MPDPLQPDPSSAPGEGQPSRPSSPLDLTQSSYHPASPPETPTPSAPTPGTPTPGTPTPGSPTPGTPAPGTPTFGQPASSPPRPEGQSQPTYASPPPAYGSAPPPASYPPPMASPPQQNNTTKYLLWGCGGCGCLTLLGLIGFFVLAASLGNKAIDEMGNIADSAENTTPQDSGTGNTDDTDDSGNTGGSASNMDMEGFANTRAGLNAKLAENYVDFSFGYPKHWTLDREGTRADEPNFVKVERKADAQSNLTLENFAVGYFTGTGSKTGDMALAPALMKQLEASFAKFPNYKKLSEGEAEFNDIYTGYQLSFESRVDDPSKSSSRPSPDSGFRLVQGNEGQSSGNALTIWGRAFILPPTEPGQKNGVTIIMLATSAATELQSIDDLGVKGELPIVIGSFRMGKDSTEQ